ncbi:glutamine amidotransferase-related protein [Escherichia coli]
MTLLIDNYVSFTWNLDQDFCELGADVLVSERCVTLADIDALKPQKIVISPGPVRQMKPGSPLRHSPLRRALADSWRLPRSSGNGAGIWR